MRADKINDVFALLTEEYERENEMWLSIIAELVEFAFVINDSDVSLEDRRNFLRYIKNMESIIEGRFK